MKVRALSGRPLEQITLENAVSGVLSPSDLRIHPDTLLHQADVAERDGNPQLAENLRRAVELTAVDDEQLMRIYEALRPHRSSAAELDSLAAELDTAGASRCAAFVREARAAYKRRGLVRATRQP